MKTHVVNGHPIPDYPDLFEACLDREVSIHFEDAGRYEWDRSAVHASDLAVLLGAEEGGCALSLWLRVHGHPEAAKHRGQRFMLRNGHLHHATLQAWVTSYLPEFYPEFEVVGTEALVYDDLIRGRKRSGRADWIVRHVPSGEVHVGDIKTVRGKSFTYNTYERAKPSHELQVRSYMERLAKVPGVERRAVGGVVVYVDREGQNYMRQAHVLPDREQVGEGWKAAFAVVEGEQPPPLSKVKGKMPWKCDYCDFRGVSCGGAT